MLKKHTELTSSGNQKGHSPMSANPDLMPVPANDVPGPEQGQWTYNHYAALPDDGKRYEIIDGVLYLMPPSPKEWHQGAVAVLTTYLVMHVKFSGRGKVYPAPFDVELAFNTVVQPDVLVVLNENLSKIIPSHVVGAPDLAVEVLSPGTARYDRVKKYNAYARAGVREYWIADPKKETVEVLHLVGETYQSAGVFSGEQKLPSLVVPDFPVRVAQIFA
jgi:Uma2 family endonuclease